MKFKVINEILPKGMWSFSFDIGYVGAESRFVIGFVLLKWNLRLLISK